MCKKDKITGIFFLIAAIISEVFSVAILMRSNRIEDYVGIIAVFICFMWSLYFMGTALAAINHKHAFVIRDIFCLTLISAMAFFFKGEHLSMVRISGMAYLISGIAIIKYSDGYFLPEKFM